VSVIDIFYYVFGIITAGLVGFKLVSFGAKYIVDNWLPYTRLTISVTDENGTKHSEQFLLDKRKPEDAEIIAAMDKITANK